MPANSYRDENTDELMRAMLTLRDVDECYRLFEDLCTIAEIREMSKRLLAASMLSENCIYTRITEETGLSTATISRVNRCLKYGEDGYKTVLSRLAEQREQSEPAKASKKTGTGEGKDE